MRIPVVLPTIHVRIADDGALVIDVDGEPHSTDRTLRREDLQSVLAEITKALDSAVRVEVQETDGTTYADIAAPPEPKEPVGAPPVAEVPEPGINGTGFRPGEEVAIAYVFARRTADAEGTAALQLPPALLAARRRGLVLFGLTSRVIAPVD